MNKNLSINKTNIEDKLSKFSDYWNPRVIAELNGQSVKLAKFLGGFVWHIHENEDEMFYVLKGKLRIEFRDKTVEISENEFIVIPKGTEHKPVAEEEVSVMLFEPTTTINTGNTTNNLTKENLEKI